MKYVAPIFLLLLAGCGEPGETPGDETPTTDTPAATEPTSSPTPVPETTVTTIALSGGLHMGDPQAGSFEVTLDGNASIELTCDEDHSPHERHRVVRTPASSHVFALHGLRASSSYTCRARVVKQPELESGTVSIVTPALPADLDTPRLVTPASDLANTGYTLFNYGALQPDGTDDDCYLTLIDARAEVRWYYRLGVCGSDLDVSFIGDDRVLLGGSAFPVRFAPTIVGLDKQIKFIEAPQLVSIYELPDSYHHDAGISEDGKSVFYLTTLGLPEGYQGFVVKQVDLETNDVIWFWDSYEEGVLKGALPAGSESNVDPYHTNAVADRWENGRLYLYLSLRDLNQVIKIDYATRQIVWRLGRGGDFALFEADGSPAADHRWFTGQHDVKPYGDSITLYDNGATVLYGSTMPTRALQLRLDESARKAFLGFEYAEPNWSEPVWGGFDMLPDGNALVAMGHCWRCGAPDEHPTALVELNPEGRVVWRAGFDSEEAMLYRADRIAGCAVFHNETYCPPGE